MSGTTPQADFHRPATESLIAGFIDEMRHAARVGLPSPARAGLPDRRVDLPILGSGSRPVAARTVSDAVVEDKVRQLAWSPDEHGRRRLAPEGLYGRRKMTALVQRTLPETSPGSVDRAMKSLGLQGIRRSKGIRTTIPAKDGKRAGDLLNRNFTAAAPNRTWIMDFERHEALSNRVGVGDLHRRAVAAAW